MMMERFDTFEDEKAFEQMIKSMQSKTMEYMTSPNAWEFDTSKEPELALK